MVRVEFGSETVPATAQVVAGEERDQLFAQFAAERPRFDGYQRRTDRVTPIVELRR